MIAAIDQLLHELGKIDGARRQQRVPADLGDEQGRALPLALDLASAPVVLTVSRPTRLRPEWRCAGRWPGRWFR